MKIKYLEADIDQTVYGGDIKIPNKNFSERFK